VRNCSVELPLPSEAHEGCCWCMSTRLAPGTTGGVAPAEVRRPFGDKESRWPQGPLGEPGLVALNDSRWPQGPPGELGLVALNDSRWPQGPLSGEFGLELDLASQAATWCQICGAAAEPERDGELASGLVGVAACILR